MIAKFLVPMSVLILAFLYLFAQEPSGPQERVFFAKTGDYMADYYNVAKYSSENQPYTNTVNGPQEKPYLPLAYVLFNFLGRFSDYHGLTAFQAGRTNLGLLSSSFFVFLCSAFFFMVLLSKMELRKWQAYLVLLTLCLSGIFLFSFERGNLAILSAALSSVFIFTYRSQQSIHREVGLVCLALAVALKVFPVLLVLLILKPGNMGMILRLMFYGIVLCLGPFLLIDGGLSNLPLWLHNTAVNTRTYEFADYPRFGYHYFLVVWAQTANPNLAPQCLDLVLGPLWVVFVLAVVVAAYFEKVEWRQVAGLVLAIVLLPVNSALYCGLYLFPVLVLFLNRPEMSRGTGWINGLFVCILNPLQISTYRYNITLILCNLAVLGLAVYLVGGSVARYLRSRSLRDSAGRSRG